MARSKKHKSEQKGSRSANSLASVPQSKGCVLFVDDDELLVQMMQEMLACLGYKAVVRTGSLEALASFQEAPHHFDFVLTDLDMPYMTGEALARQLWEIRPDIPIILCTGGSAMTWEKAQLLGFDALLTKPFGLHDIALAIERVLTQRAAQKT
jgi:CheY-like chemotaxis protein